MRASQQVVAERPPYIDHPNWPQFADHVARYVFASDYVKGRRVLDAGTGSGYGAVMLKAAGAQSVVAVDLDGDTIAQARRFYAKSAVEFLVDNCEELANVKGPFDLICSFENIEHLPRPERFLAAAARLLSPDGTLIVSTPDRAGTDPFINGRPANPYHFHEWYGDEFIALLSGSFAQCELRVQVKSFSIERRRQGAAALVRHLKRNPIARLRGIASVLLRKRSYWAPILDLATPSPLDYPIIGPEVALFLGTPWCHMAICTEPTKD
jgi:SAM-dependent methyltransferase